MKKIFLLGLSFVTSSLAWALPANVQVLKQSGNSYLVKTENGREAVYVENEGKDLFIGYVGRIRKGTPLYHWGNATPEQAAKWNAAGSISPDLLKFLINTNNGAYGGGFYASMSRTDSISYGNTQITIVIPHDVKIVDKAKNADKILNVAGINENIAKLGISAFRNSEVPTWHNFIDVNSLTKEHVTTTVEWVDSWSKNPEKMELILKYPDILQISHVKKENRRYWNYMNLLRSPDLNTQYLALEYFYSIGDPMGLRLSLTSISKRDPENPRFIEIARAVLRSKDNETRVLTAEFFTNWRTPQGTKMIIEYYRDFPNEYARMTLLSGHDGPEVVEVLRDVLSKNKNKSDYDGLVAKRVVREALPGRSDPESLEFIKELLKTERADLILECLTGRKDPASLEIIESLMDKNKSYAIRALKGRNDAKSFELIENLLKDPDVNTQKLALYALAGRTEPKVLKLIESLLRSSSDSLVVSAIESLNGRQDEKSLGTIKRMFKEQAEGKLKISLYGVVSALRGRSDAASLPLLKKVILGDNYHARLLATEILVARSDAKAIEMLSKLIANNQIEPNVVESVKMSFNSSGRFSPQQIQANINALPINDVEKYKFTQQAVTGSIEKHVSAPVCKSLFSL